MVKFIVLLTSAVAGTYAWKGCNVNAYDSYDCSGDLLSYTSYDCDQAQSCESQTGISVQLQCFGGCEATLSLSSNSQCLSGILYPAGYCANTFGNPDAHSSVIF